MPCKVAFKNFTNTQINFTSVGNLFLCIVLPSSWDESSGLVRSAIFAGMSRCWSGYVGVANPWEILHRNTKLPLLLYLASLNGGYWKIILIINVMAEDMHQNLKKRPRITNQQLFWPRNTLFHRYATLCSTKRLLKLLHQLSSLIALFVLFTAILVRMREVIL